MSQATSIDQLKQMNGQQQYTDNVDPSLIDSLLSQMKGAEAGDLPQMKVESYPNSNIEHVMDAGIHHPAGTPQLQDIYNMMHSQQPIDASLAAEHAQNKDSSFSSTVSNMVMTELRGPLIVALLVVIFQLPAINKIIQKFLPQLISTGDEISIVGVTLKGIVAGLLFYIANTFLLK